MRHPEGRSSLSGIPVPHERVRCTFFRRSQNRRRGSRFHWIRRRAFPQTGDVVHGDRAERSSLTRRGADKSQKGMAGGQREREEFLVRGGSRSDGGVSPSSVLGRVRIEGDWR